MLKTPRGNQIFQAAWIVPDLRKSVDRWVRTMGVGPFFLLEKIPLEVSHRGVNRVVECTFALAQAGPLQIELVYQHSPGPSCYRDSVPNDDGFHHVAAFCDYDREVEAYKKMGYELATSGVFGDMRYCYVDTTKTLGFMVELLEESATTREHFEKVTRAAENWDGRDPIRSLL
jgi:hypothetical protein